MTTHPFEELPPKEPEKTLAEKTSVDDRILALDIEIEKTKSALDKAQKKLIALFEGTSNRAQLNALEMPIRDEIQKAERELNSLEFQKKEIENRI
ncbi:MAG: hypothetical protein HYV67_01645 [Candidatus Taylorbacteria bacterium]|nr:hypothetical protein [Candidatus Taylorbacteria bacterium]